MDVFVARQPIFNKNMDIFGYELLFRNSNHNFYTGNLLDGDAATSEVIVNSFLLIGIDDLTRGKKAFINFTHRLLNQEIATALPRSLIAVEILENVKFDSNILEVCKRLKQLDYVLVLDDFTADSHLMPLAEYADIIKVDFLNTNIKARKDIIKKVCRRNVKFLAEKVESRQQFTQALEMGYSYFQGYFFSKPDIFTKRDIPARKAIYLNILREINREELDFETLENFIKRDVSLSFKLLKFINSAFFGMRAKIRSIRQTLALLGKSELSKWLSLISLREVSRDHCNELLINSIVRARFAEMIAEKIGLKYKAPDAFLMGLFSMIGIFFNRPTAEVLDELGIAEDIQIALSGGQNRLREIYDLIVSYERAEWANFELCAGKLNINSNDVPAIYLQALHWANEFESTN